MGPITKKDIDKEIGLAKKAIRRSYQSLSKAFPKGKIQFDPNYAIYPHDTFITLQLHYTLPNGQKDSFGIAM